MEHHLDGCGSQDSESDRLRSRVLDADFRCWAHLGHSAMSDLWVERKLDFGAIRSPFDPGAGGVACACFATGHLVFRPSRARNFQFPCWFQFPSISDASMERMREGCDVEIGHWDCRDRACVPAGGRGSGEGRWPRWRSWWWPWRRSRRRSRRWTPWWRALRRSWFRSRSFWWRASWWCELHIPFVPARRPGLQPDPECYGAPHSFPQRREFISFGCLAQWPPAQQPCGADPDCGCGRFGWLAWRRQRVGGSMRAAVTAGSARCSGPSPTMTCMTTRSGAMASASGLRLSGHLCRHLWSIWL